MFDNVGGKLKIVAKVCCWAGIALAVICGVAYGIVSKSFLLAVLTAVGGAIVFWVGSLEIYALGELVENSDIRTNLAVKADVERENAKKEDDLFNT